MVAGVTATPWRGDGFREFGVTQLRPRRDLRSDAFLDSSRFFGRQPIDTLSAVVRLAFAFDSTTTLHAVSSGVGALCERLPARSTAVSDSVALSPAVRPAARRSTERGSSFHAPVRGGASTLSQVQRNA